MEDNIVIEFTKGELKDIVMNFYGIEEDEFDLNNYTDKEIKQALLESSAY